MRLVLPRPADIEGNWLNKCAGELHSNSPARILTLESTGRNSCAQPTVTKHLAVSHLLLGAATLEELGV